MSFRYQKRIKLGKGFGLNLSKKGVSTSYRTNRGSIGSRSYSIRTGIHGLTYRKTFSKSNKGGCTGMFLLLIVLGFSLTILLTI